MLFWMEYFTKSGQLYCIDQTDTILVVILVHNVYGKALIVVSFIFCVNNDHGLYSSNIPKKAFYPMFLTYVSLKVAQLQIGLAI